MFARAAKSHREKFLVVSVYRDKKMLQKQLISLIKAVKDKKKLSKVTKKDIRCHGCCH
jgi:hypothetical protein